jgi:hypothetical protein
MTTKNHTYQQSTALLILFATVTAVLVSAVAALLGVTANSAPPEPTSKTLELYGDDGFELGFQGFAGGVHDTKRPKLVAYFTSESYGPGDTARLIITDTAPAVTLRFFRAGGEDCVTVRKDVMLGTPVSKTLSLGPVHRRREIRLSIGDWPSGVYFAELRCGARIGYAPFVLRPRRLGEHRVAVVMPTETWQAYNYRDDDGDGYGDTWYAGWRTNKARLIRPFLNRGVPPHWKQYDAPFVRWLTHTGRAVDYLSDAELRSVNDGGELADAYTLIVFSGHHEYVTTHEYDVVEAYRDLGGNLAFLSANNFFWKIELHRNVMTRVDQWRRIGRPEAALIGVQYRANDDGSHRGPWIVRTTASTPWLFKRTGIGKGDCVGSGGIEIDKTAPSSPKNTRILAEIPNLYGAGYTGQMTYYQTPAGAKVFAAGAFTLAGSVWQQDVSSLVENLWHELAVA